MGKQPLANLQMAWAMVRTDKYNDAFRWRKTMRHSFESRFSEQFMQQNSLPIAIAVKTQP